ncbi:MAG: DUF6364 family protein [Anaerolineae bacterium]|nr:DUF6364 family protein [Anaerolineae bacterium]NUQ04998.1 ribbon-helix-helix protein, CopG family [Anaerolineae bacterium]
MTTIELDDRVIEKLRRRAEREKRSMSEVVDDLIERAEEQAVTRMTREEARRALAGFIAVDMPEGAEGIEQSLIDHVRNKHSDSD